VRHLQPACYRICIKCFTYLWRTDLRHHFLLPPTHVDEHVARIQEIDLDRFDPTHLFFESAHYSARSYSFAAYWIHFMARFDGVHAFGYNSAGGEPMWMKFAYCLPLAPTDFGRDPRRSKSETARRIFCEVSNARLRRLPVGQISLNLHTRPGSMRW